MRQVDFELALLVYAFRSAVVLSFDNAVHEIVNFLQRQLMEMLLLATHFSLPYLSREYLKFTYLTWNGILVLLPYYINIYISKVYYYYHTYLTKYFPYLTLPYLTLLYLTLPYLSLLPVDFKACH